MKRKYVLLMLLLAAIVVGPFAYQRWSETRRLNQIKEARHLAAQIDATSLVDFLNQLAQSKREETVDFYTRQLEKEIGDTFIYLDLLAQRCGLDMYTCIATAFNQVSEREGYPHRLL